MAFKTAQQWSRIGILALCMTALPVTQLMAAQSGRDAHKPSEAAPTEASQQSLGSKLSQHGQGASKKLNYVVEPLPENKPSMATQRGLHADKNSGFWLRTDKKHPGQYKQHPQIRLVDASEAQYLHEPPRPPEQAADPRPANEIKPSRQQHIPPRDPDEMSENEKNVREYLKEQEEAQAKRPPSRDQRGNGYNENVGEMKKSQDRLSPTQPGRNRMHR